MTGVVFPLSFLKRGADVYVIHAVIPLYCRAREGDTGGEFREVLDGKYKTLKYSIFHHEGTEVTEENTFMTFMLFMVRK